MPSSPNLVVRGVFRDRVSPTLARTWWALFMLEVSAEAARARRAINAG